jgi:DNA-binding NarL/FixJ family response regulator
MIHKATAGAPIRVLVVDDNATFGRNLERWLNRTPGFTCEGVCNSGEAALIAVPEKNPDVVLMDISMPGISGVECTARLRKKIPHLQIIALTVYQDTETIFNALRAGASGYLLKRSSMTEILNAIRDIRQGGAPMTGAIARRLVEAFQEPPATGTGDSELTDREREILDSLARGFSNKEIAGKLEISPLTVKAHLAHIFEKLHVRSRTEAVMAYLKPSESQTSSARVPPKSRS